MEEELKNEKNNKQKKRCKGGEEQKGKRKEQNGVGENEAEGKRKERATE
jgi:hypothetical protein